MNIKENVGEESQIYIYLYQYKFTLEKHINKSGQSPSIKIPGAGKKTIKFSISQIGCYLKINIPKLPEIKNKLTDKRSFDNVKFCCRLIDSC